MNDILGKRWAELGIGTEVTIQIFDPLGEE